MGTKFNIRKDKLNQTKFKPKYLYMHTHKRVYTNIRTNEHTQLQKKSRHIHRCTGEAIELCCIASWLKNSVKLIYKSVDTYIKIWIYMCVWMFCNLVRTCFGLTPKFQHRTELYFPLYFGKFWIWLAAAQWMRKLLINKKNICFDWSGIFKKLQTFALTFVYVLWA